MPRPRRGRLELVHRRRPAEDVDRQEARGALVDRCARRPRGRRQSVAGSTSQKTGRAPSKSRQLDEAMKLSGVVRTSSPGPHPIARTARWSAAVPLETATASATPRRRAKSASKRGEHRAERERSPSAAPRGRAPPRARRGPVARAVSAPRRSSVPGDGGGSPAAAVGAARLEGVLERVDERLPGSLDDVLGDAERAPRARAPSEESRRTRVTEAVPWCSSRIRTLKLVSSTSAISGCCSVIAARSARSSALTGPFPSAVRM